MIVELSMNAGPQNCTTFVSPGAIATLKGTEVGARVYAPKPIDCTSMRLSCRATGVTFFTLSAYCTEILPVTLRAASGMFEICRIRTSGSTVAVFGDDVAHAPRGI